MKSLEDKLPPQTFRRIHRSFIVNMNKIQALDGSVVEVMEKGQVKTPAYRKKYRDELLGINQRRKYNGLFHEHKATQLVESIAPALVCNVVNIGSGSQLLPL